MRIITGKYKGRHFDIPRTFKARPTTDFAKENLFNVLTAYVDFEGAAALDLFAGTGSITLELLSRGCAPVVCVELDRDHHRFIQQCIMKLQGDANGQRSKVKGQRSMVSHQPSAVRHQTSAVRHQTSDIHCQCIRGDVFRFVKSCRHQFDFIFADPPYALKELATIPDLILGAPNADPSQLTPRPSLLKPGGVFVLEHGSDHDFSNHPHLVDHRQYGSVNFSLFQTPEGL